MEFKPNSIDLLFCKDAENVSKDSELKSTHANLLEYSMIEGQIMPDSCDSSPDIELQHRRLFHSAVSPLASNNITILDEYDESLEESDESFVRMEQYIKQTTPRNLIFNRIDEVPESVTQISDADTLKNVSELTSDSTADESLKFNDTLEEMDYFIRKGAEQITAVHVEKEKPKVVPKEEKVHCEERKLPISAMKVPESPKPKISKNLNLNLNSNKKVTPVHKVTPFKVPLRSKMTPGSNTPKSRSYATTPKSGNPVGKHENIMSPIRYLIKNSPSIHMVQNVSPVKNYWDRVPREPVSTVPHFLKRRQGKENVELPEKAYKSPISTRMVERPTNRRLPHSNRVATMTENIPKPMVIKHVKREKLLDTPETKLKFQNGNPTEKNEIEDSFAHLSVNCVDISHCIGSMAPRSRTLK